MRQDGASTQNIEVKAPQEAIFDLPQERITGDILRGRGPRRGNLERLIKYWRPIMRKPGGFRRCLVILADHPELYPLERICAWLHHETTGMWPNEGNHHAGGKLGKIKRVIKKPRRRKRGKSFEVEAGIDIPIERIERRLERKAGSVVFAPLDGTMEQIDYKSSKATRIVKAVESILLPGERGALKPRHLLATGLTPGGSGLPGPKMGPRPGRILRGGGGGKVRGFRCPPGFERGGHFTDSRFSTCGRQLFGIPGSSRTALRTVAAAADNQTREKVGIVYAEYKAVPAAGVGGGMPALPDTVGAANPAKQSSMVSKVLKSMSGVSDTTNAPVRRLVREDGSILQPLAPLNVIGKQKNNSDLKNASLLTRINAPGAFGADELALMQTGLKSIEFSLPGGGSVSLKRTGGLMSPGKARAFGKAIAAARRAGGADSDYAAILRETAAKTNAVTFSVDLPGETNPGRLVRTDGGKHVPYWVYKTFLTDGAPGKAKGASSVAVEEAVGKSLKADAVKRLGQETLRTWGPLQYTAALIPDYDEIDRTVGVTYKAAAYSAYRRDISWAFVEEKRASSVWDRGISRFRCPPGTPDAGQITNRFGLGCASAVAKRMLEAFRGVRRDVGEATSRANRARRGDVAQRRQGKPARRVRSVTNIGPHIEIDRGLADRIQRAVEGVGSGLTRQRALGRRRERGERGRLLDRIGFALDVPAGDIESANLAQQARGRRGDVLRRIGDVFAPGATGQNTRRANLLDRIGDVFNPETGRLPDRTGKTERRANLLQRIGNVFNPVRIREEREADLLPTGQRFDISPEMVDWNRIAARAQLDLMDMSWKRRLGKNVLEDGDHRDWLLRNGADLDVDEFDRLENEVLDIEAFRKALSGPNENLAAALDRLSPNIQGIVRQDAVGRRAQFDANEAAQLSLERRRRDNLNINFPDGFSVDKEALNELDSYRAGQVNIRVERHNNKIEAAFARVREGKADKAEVDKLIADMVRERNGYETAAALNEGNYTSPQIAQKYVGDAAIAEAYRRALPELVDEARRFERLDALKRDKDNKLGALIFNDQIELANVPASQVPKGVRDKYDNWVIGIGNADNPEELKSIVDEMDEVVREANESVKGFNILLRDANIDDARVLELAKLRGEAAWEGEAARRALVDARRRRTELGGAGDVVYPHPDRTNGNLGAYNANGVPVVESVPVGNAGISTKSNAINYVKSGGDLKDVPDKFLTAAIKENPARFEEKYDNAGNINPVSLYTDRSNGRIYIIKEAYKGPHEGIAEITSNQIAAQLGFPVGAMRVGGDADRKGALPIVFEHVANLVDASKVYRADELGRRADVAKARLNDPKTLARGFLLDFVIDNHGDRHHQNWFLGERSDGVNFFSPIDHGLAFGYFDGRITTGKKLTSWDDTRMRWTRVMGEKLGNGDITTEDLIDEIETAIKELDINEMYSMLDSVEGVLPGNYDQKRKGVDWRKTYREQLEDRIGNLKSLSREELLAWANNL